MTHDFGTASVTIRASDGTRIVDHADPIIGVDDCLLYHWDMRGALDGDLLTLDTAGEYRYRRLGPSGTTPDVTRYERITDEQEQQP